MPFTSKEYPLRGLSKELNRVLSLVLLLTHLNGAYIVILSLLHRFASLFFSPSYGVVPAKSAAFAFDLAVDQIGYFCCAYL